MRKIFGLFFVLLFLTAAYAQAQQSPQWLWARQAHTAPPGQPFGHASQLSALKASPDGGVVAAGFFSGTLSIGSFQFSSLGNEDCFVARYDAAGTLLWATTFRNRNEAYLTGISLDSAGAVLVCGWFADSLIIGNTELMQPNSANGFVARLDAYGSVEWARKVPRYPTAVAALPDGRFYLGGRFAGTALFDNIALTSATPSSSEPYLAMYAATGAAVWAVSLPAAGGVGADLLDLAADAAGNCYGAGRFDGTIAIGSQTFYCPDYYYGFACKFDSAGQVQWSKHLAGSGDWYTAMGIAADASGMVALTGSFSGTLQVDGQTVSSAGGHDAFVVALDPSGQALWAQRAGGTAPYQLGAVYEDIGNKIAFDGAGNCYVTGAFLGAASFGSGVTVSSQGPHDAFVASYAPTGALRWALRAGGNAPSAGAYPYTDIGRAIDATLAGQCYVGGYFRSTAVLGTDTLTSQTADMFLAKLDHFLARPEHTPASALQVFPNPTSHSVTVQLPAAVQAGATVRIVSATGRVVQSLEVRAMQQVQLPVQQLARGLYLVQVQSGQQRWVQKVVVE